MRIATYASVITAVVLIASKLVAWLLTGSVSVLASLVDSAMDAGASTVNLIAVHYALQPADAEHRFGHGKAESLAGLGQATFIAGSAVFLVLHAIDRILHPQPLTQIGVGVLVMVFAIAATMVLLTIQRYVIKRTQSTAVRADALHYATDVLTNAATLVALVLATMGWPGLDPVFALLIAAYILFSAWRIGHEAFHLLIDRELPDDERRRIETIALSDARVHGIHGLRTRLSGRTPIIQLHLELDDNLSLVQAHAIATDVSQSIRAQFPDADIVIHQDPFSLGDESRTD
ncbi:MAG: ferrous iron transporter [Gammaproteobacteria bacterium SG8_47]|nr:MAG: ferrous iron transporter [Gammaproteobacteria bacterium SG8_47]